MQLTLAHARYWRCNFAVTLALLALWFVVTFVCAWYARELNAFDFIGPLGFYIGAQGALIVYVGIIGFYAWFMERLDRTHGVEEDEA